MDYVWCSIFNSLIDFCNDESRIFTIDLNTKLTTATQVNNCYPWIWLFNADVTIKFESTGARQLLIIYMVFGTG